MHQKEWSGERLETHIKNDTTTEHLHRYALANKYVAGKKVLDIACGEGYGTMLLSKNALHVTGIDIDMVTIEKAAQKYINSNIIFKWGSILQIPEDNNQFDVITCFETLEHLEEHYKVLAELKRVLKDDGLLIISTPDKLIYTDKKGKSNKFHVKELYVEEFKKLVSEHFNYQEKASQIAFIFSIIQCENNDSSFQLEAGNFSTIEKNIALEFEYIILLASDKKIAQPQNTVFLFSEVDISFIEDINKFYYEKGEKTGFQEGQKIILNTYSYKIGYLLLLPIKFIRKLFKANRKNQPS